MDRLLAVGIAIVELEAPGRAIETIQNEAVIRSVAWLFQTGISIGELSIDNQDARGERSSSFRRSGVVAAPWIERTI